MDFCKRVYTSWCYCRYCKTFPKLAAGDADFVAPTTKRSGDAWVRFADEPKAELTQQNLALLDEKNRKSMDDFKDRRLMFALLRYLIATGNFPTVSKMVAIKIIHLIEEFAGHQEDDCDSQASFALSRAPSHAVSLTTSRTVQWGDRKFTPAHFQDDMENLQVAKHVLDAWDATNAKHREACEDEREPTPDMSDCRPKIVLNGIPTWEWTVEELESFRRDRNDDLLWIAKKQAKSAIYALLQNHGVPRRLKYRVGIGAGWFGYSVRSNDRAFLTFDYCPEAFSQCERLVANGITTDTNIVKISWDQSDPRKQGKNGY